MTEVSPQEAQGLAAGAGGAFLLDVREAEEVAAGHAPGSVHVALATLVDNIASLPRDRRIVCICRSGARSGRAAQILAKQGFDAVNMSGGMNAWAAAGLDVEAADGTPGRVI
ncbi:MAG: rhodanese-like domain-containing protein [Acidimicrobiia bacterium]|nr:rhodanese-like domain-containing protein [Acidimicrobiia bacterium]